MGFDKLSVHPPQTFKSLGQDLSAKVKEHQIGRFVSWLKQPGHKAAKVFAGVIASAACIGSGVGIYALWKGKRYSNQLNSYAHLLNKNQVASPPPFTSVHLKTETASFNHINNYAIHDGALWYKPKNSLDDEWKMFYFDGWGKGELPVAIRVDGANLMILDNNREIHYKKVLLERNDSNGYHFKDLTEEDNWKKFWFNLPIIGPLVNCVMPKRLKLPEDIIDWALSHRGQFNFFFEDLKGRRHSEFAMVTTVVALKKDGSICYADPFLTYGFKHNIPGPKDSDFKADAISASASTIFLKGSSKDPDNVKLFTLTAGDYDLRRNNPFLPGFWSKYMAPPQEWVEQPAILLTGQATLGNHITIFQTGRGNDARELRVLGTNSHGITGFYSKPIHAAKSDAWIFTES